MRSLYAVNAKRDRGIIAVWKTKQNQEGSHARQGRAGHADITGPCSETPTSIYMLQL
jgi:hypothetical protein